jgi:lipid II:glycine glycyltransferase (peptidoglycan interpeptide bridge formation enzyme)
MQIRILQESEYSQWDELVKNHPQSCFMQSSAWAKFKELEGYKTFYYGIFQSQNLVGGCILYYHSNHNQTNLLMATGGPYLPPECPEIALKLLQEEGIKLGKKLGAIALRIEPLWQEKPEYLSEFVRTPFDLLPSETLLINLKTSASERLVQMTQKGRYNLRLSWRQGVTTEFTTNSQAIPIFYNLFWETVQQKNFFGEPYRFFINLCQTLFAANMAEIGLAKWQNKIIAAIIIYWGEKATYLYGGRSFETPEIKASYALHWQAMQQALKRGCRIYDFYGFSQDPQHNYAKFSQFKRQFGGERVTTIGAHDYFFYEQLAERLILALNFLV